MTTTAGNAGVVEKAAEKSVVDKAETEKTATEKTAVAERPAAVPDKRRALGRGLESLLPSGPRVVTSGTSAAAPGTRTGAATSLSPVNAGGASAAAAGTVIGDLQAQAARVGDQLLQIPLGDIDENPYQTRRLGIDEETEAGGSTLEELAESIKTNGVIQPITVRLGKDGRYVLITGERRWKASKLAGKEKIPAIVRQVSDQQAAEMTIVENLQRQDLNCMEQAAAFARLSQDFGMTQEMIGKRVGVSRETVSNYMRLLRLPGTVMEYLSNGMLGFSEARVLLTVLNHDLLPKIADDAVKKNLSVEQLEELVMSINMPLRKEGQEQQFRARWVDPNVRAAQRELERVLGLKVRIRDRKGRGKIVIEYASVDDYDRVVGMLKGK